MRKALIIGINAYPTAPLAGCINDANRMNEVLARNEDDSINFHTRVVTDETMPVSNITNQKVIELAQELFNGESDIALFYFSGHGFTDATGGKLVTPDFKKPMDGISMSDLLQIANKSKARDKFIILDCCYSGQFGTFEFGDGNTSVIANGVTILTACSNNESAWESNGRSVFTSLIVDALKGGAADLRGNVTPGSLYAYVDEALNAWEQRPIFKTNVSRFTSLRQCKPPIDLSELRKITSLFPDKDYVFPLCPEYEPQSGCPDKDKTKIFSILQHYNRIRLLVPVGEEHMYFAAMNRKACKLTALGHQYWRLVKENKI